MTAPISLGTLLRQRYLIQHILGQGGFGRTYLAIDQERFDERCVLKEFFVPYQDDALLKKSQLLFQREASTLYQLQHPQIPRFWAAFEEGQRLFLVQDFVDGHTYRHLLQERRPQGKAFAEIEVLYFLQKILPVLTYIHDRDIIHRDISPENIVLKPDPSIVASPSSHLTETGLPMLIDFGAVKAATTHWSVTSAITRVGKVGYAPPEQLQTGQVYPNSDLYALAATCLVLLTGKEPRSLVDSQTLEWRWQPYTLLSQDFAALLQRMLRVYPGDRYPSAPDVLHDLTRCLAQYYAETAAITASQAVPIGFTSGALAPTLLSSNNPMMPSVAAKSQLSGLRSQVKHLSDRLHPSKSKRLRLALSAAFMVGTGVAGGWAWERWTKPSKASGEVWISGAKLPQAEASKIIGVQGAMSNNSVLRSPIAPNLQERQVSMQLAQPQLIQFPPGKVSTTLIGTLQDNVPQSYILQAEQGQILTTTLNGSGVVMNVLRSNQDGIDAAAYQTRSWTGQLPQDDQYLIQISGSGGYTLDIAITPTSRPTQNRVDRISFARGTNGTTVTGSLMPKQIRRYLLKATQGQLVLVKVIQGKVNFSAIAPNGQRLGGTTAASKDWKGQLPIAGDYVIEVSAAQPGDFVLSFEIF